MQETIIVVDDEVDILELVCLHLEKSGFRTVPCPDPQALFEALERTRADLIILDLMLPGTDGIEICKHLRSHEDYRHIPIIMLTARATETDKVLGLEIGADDYVTKPFSPRELVARVKTVLRRKMFSKEKPSIITIADILKLDPERFEVYVEGKKIDLTSTEFRILKILAEKKGKVFTRSQILDLLWGDEKAVLDRTIDVHIKHLRDKLGKAAGLIKNIRGIGYKISDE